MELLLKKHRRHALSLYRIVVGLLFACHGAATLLGVLGGPQGGHAPSTGQWPHWWAAGIELIGGGLVLLGLATRSTASICSGSMAYAYFTEHQPEALFPIENGGEAAAMFCWAFLMIAFYGPGRWALDSRLDRLPTVRGRQPQRQHNHGSRPQAG
ncbi:DoxX family protein [Streptomyces sp. MAR4 CNX-425]|uniref:DoxX family protein n=1 Tax=Streptomyces sp. MAR4 CNX-425 TaxID=3406343 RepID=UPI003B514D74